MTARAYAFSEDIAKKFSVQNFLLQVHLKFAPQAALETT
jgi:hypothetical protein